MYGRMAYALNCTDFAMLWRGLPMRFMRRHTGRMQYAPTTIANPQLINFFKTLRKLYLM